MSVIRRSTRILDLGLVEGFQILLRVFLIVRIGLSVLNHQRFRNLGTAKEQIQHAAKKRKGHDHKDPEQFGRRVRIDG